MIETQNLPPLRAPKRVIYTTTTNQSEPFLPLPMPIKIHRLCLIVLSPHA